MYIPVFWEDRVVEFPRRYSAVSLGNGLYECLPAPGEIITKGTQQSKRNFGNMCGKNRAEVYGTGKAHAIWKCNDSFSETGRNILFGKRHIGRIRKILSS